MQRISTLVLVVVALLVSGCAGDTTPTPTTTNATTTPTTGATPTPTPTSAPTNDTNESEEMPVARVCPTQPASNATASSVLGYSEIVYTVKEASDADPCFRFVGPDSVEAGWTAVTLRNTGMSPHIMPMYRVNGSAINETQLRTLLTQEGEPEGLVPMGGVGFATPFSEGTVLMNLTEGQYVVVCFFGGHHFEGMYRLLNVTAATDAENATGEPTANYTIEMKNFAYLAPNMTNGTHVVAFVNNGTQPHEAPLILLQGNTTAMEFLNAIEDPNATGPPRGSGVGGVNVVAPGDTVYGIVRAVPGHYAMVCFVEDPASHQPHVALGMIGEFYVA